MARVQRKATSTEDADLALLEGGPTDGQETTGTEDEDTGHGEGSAAETQAGGEGASELAPSRAELEAFRGEMAALRRENESLRRSIPPAQPAAAAAADPEIDWEKLLYENPKEALRLHGEHVKAEVKAELTGQYQRDQGARSFWQEFYDKYPDLRDDHDLVQQTLETNFKDMATLSVPKALKKLAALTQDRILRYSGKGKTSGKKAVVEGSGSGLPKKPVEEKQEISSLSDIIRARRKQRGLA